IEGYEFATSTLRFSYSSPTTPSEVFDYDMESRERVLRKVQEVPSGHDPGAYVARRIMAPAPDGETVPVSLVHRRDTPLDGRAPLWLYGYGSYGVTVPAAFNTNILSLIDRGFIYAIAHVRGGKDKGYRWYREGKRRQKMNTFTDFIAVARHLVAEGITGEANIVAHRDRAPGAQLGRQADGGPGQSGAGVLPGDPRRGAVRRCPQHHARRHAAAHPAGVAGMGQPDRIQGRLRNHRRLFAL